RHFHILRDVEVSARGFQHRPDGRRREQARRATPEEHARHKAAPDLRRLRGDIARKSRHVRLLRELAVQRVRVEVAVRALPYAPGKVHVERERWCNECGHAEGWCAEEAWQCGVLWYPRGDRSVLLARGTLRAIQSAMIGVDQSASIPPDGQGESDETRVACANRWSGIGRIRYRSDTSPVRCTTGCDRSAS